MAAFSARNFPRNVGNNSNFVGAGERTTYVPISENLSNYKYSQGFQTSKFTLLFGKDGSIVKHLMAGQTVHFVHPAELYNAKDLGIVSKYIMAAISLKSANSPPDGYVAISAVIKPPGKNQGRVGAGSRTQDMVANYIKDYCYQNKIEAEDQYKVASSGSTKADLIMTIGGKPVQFEIKGTSNSSAPITFFDKSVRRSSKMPKQIDDIAKIFIDKLRLPIKGTGDFISLIDYYKSVDPTIGLAGDEGVIKSGKLPPQLKTTDHNLLSDMRKLILEHFKKDIVGGDDYFVVHDRSSDKFDIYYVGGGKADNVLKMPDLPKFKSFELGTYGGVSSGSTRVGLKITF